MISRKRRRERREPSKLTYQQPSPARTIIDSYRAMFPFLRKYYVRILIEIVFLGGFVFFAIIAPFLSRYAVDEVILAGNVQALYMFVLLVMGLFAFALVWKFFASLWQALTRQGFSVDLRRELFLSLQAAPFDVIGRLFRPGEIAYRYLADVDTLEGRIISFITQGVGISGQSGHPFRNKAATRFGRFRPPVSVLTGHFLAVSEIGGRFAAK